MDPDVEFTPGHSYINEDNTYPRPYLILAKNDGAVAFFVPTKKETGISTYAFIRSLDREWKHSSDCSCHRNHE